jgi:hypothetical protein
MNGAGALAAIPTRHPRRTRTQSRPSRSRSRTYPDRIARYERGERVRDLDEVSRLAETLGVPPAVLTATAITLHSDGRIEVAHA